MALPCVLWTGLKRDLFKVVGCSAWGILSMAFQVYARLEVACSTCIIQIVSETEREVAVSRSSTETKRRTALARNKLAMLPSGDVYVSLVTCILIHEVNISFFFGTCWHPGCSRVGRVDLCLKRWRVFFRFFFS